MRLGSWRGSSGERGQVVVFFALMIPVFFALGAVVLDVGNWYVHKRHLQTQVDAGVLASAPKFTGCFQQDPAARAGAIQGIADDALKYAGDSLRDPTTTNLQVQEPGDVRVVLNSSRYWDPSDGKIPGTNGYGLDFTAATPGDPCSTSSLDAKATDEDAPPLWGLIPFTPSPKTHAKIEIRDVLESTGMLPLAVPEVDPRAVAAIFVDEFDGNVLSALELNETACPDPDGPLGPLPAYPYKCWGVDFPSVLVNTDNIGVVVLVSRDDPDPTLGGSLDQICNPPGNGTGINQLIICYAGSGNQSGLSFIHGYSTSSGGVDLQNPRVRDVRLTDVTCAGGGDYSSPYFLMNGDCTVAVRAVIDFGIPLAPNPSANPKCVEVTLNPGGTTMAFQNDGVDGAVFTGSVTLAAATGRNVISITTLSKNPARALCQQQITRSFSPVAAPYVADDNSGPVQYVTLENLSAPFGLANSTPQSSTARPIRVTVGLQQPLALQDPRTPPVLLRLGSNPGSQTQALDCDDSNLAGPSGNHTNFRNEFEDGCLTWYKENFSDWNTPPDGVEEWTDIRCTQYQSLWGTQPPDDQFNTPTPNCIAIQPGVSAGQFQDALQARFASPCTDNNWPDVNATDDEVADFFMNYDFLNDPRYVTLVIADFTAFAGSGASDPRPIKVFGGFYYTGSGPVNCTGDDPHPLGVTGQRARFDMWGHYVNVVQFTGASTPSDRLCSFTSTEAGNCVAVLVE